jgi:hypothetical protein
MSEELKETHYKGIQIGQRSKDIGDEFVFQLFIYAESIGDAIERMRKIIEFDNQEAKDD